MHSKLAGHLPLQDMIAQTLDSARAKMAAAEDNDKVKKLVAYEKKEHGGKVPSVKDEENEEKEKKSSILDFEDPDDMSKLASALDEFADELLKEADSIENGGESKQGGEQLATQSPTGGKQVYTGAKAKHQVPTSTGMQGDPSQGKAQTQVPNDHARAPGGTGAKYPAKGVLKTAGGLPPAFLENAKKVRAAQDSGKPGAEKPDLGAPGKKEEDEKDEKKEKKSGVELLESVVEKVAFAVTEEGHKFDAARAKDRKEYLLNRSRALQDKDALGHAGEGGKNPAKLTRVMRFNNEGHPTSDARHQAYVEKKHSEGKNAYNPFGGALTALKEEKGSTPGFFGSLGKVGKSKEKKSSAVDFILDKLAEFHGGGETLDDKPAPIPSNEGRQLIANNKAPVSATKREAKSPGRKQLSEVLSEPAQTKSTDSTVQDNLRNAAKGGVKIAAVKDYLRKIAEAGCVCAGAGECDYCRMKASVDKKRADKKTKASMGTPPMGPAPMAGGPMGGSPAGGM